MPKRFSFNTPKALANFSPGLERQRQPRVAIQIQAKPWKGSPTYKPFQGLIVIFVRYPGLSLRSNRWAEISQRLRRKRLKFCQRLRRTQTKPVLKLIWRMKALRRVSRSGLDWKGFWQPVYSPPFSYCPVRHRRLPTSNTSRYCWAGAFDLYTSLFRKGPQHAIPL